MPELDPLNEGASNHPSPHPEREPGADAPFAPAAEPESKRGRRRLRLGIASLAVAAVVASGILTAVVLTPPHHVALGAGRSSAATPCPAPPQPSAAQLQQAQQRFALQLAQALGKPESEVEQTLTQFQQSLPKPPPGAQVQSVKVGPDPAMLAPIAAQLGVTAQELSDAMTAAAPPLPACPPSPGQNGPVTVKLDATRMFDHIAQQLGHGLTGAQVQAAFESARQNAGFTDRAQAGEKTTITPGGPDDPLTRLAAALNVTPEQLKAALQSIAKSSGCPEAPQTVEHNAPAGGQDVGFAVSAGGAPGVMFCLNAKP